MSITKKPEQDFDFATEEAVNTTGPKEVIPAKDTKKLISEKNESFHSEKNESFIVEKSAGPGNTVRRTQEQEESLSFNRY